MKKPYELIIFDWDGTLMDSLETIIYSIHEAGREAGLRPLSDKEAAHIIGLSLDQALAALWPEATETQRQAAAQAYRRAFFSDRPPPSKPFPGARQTLQWLKDQGYRLAIATGKSRKGLEKAMSQAQFADFFEATQVGEETASKPDPTMLKQLLVEFNLAPDQALMVGDTSYDLQMAQKIAMPRVGVTYGVHDAQTLASFKPLALLDDLPSLRDFLIQQTR